MDTNKEARNAGANLRTIVVSGLVVVAILVSLAWAWQKFCQAPVDAAKALATGLSSAMHQAFNITPQVTINKTVFIQGTTPLAELATVQKRMTINYVFEDKWLHSQKRMTLKGRFTAKAGFDLHKPFRLDVHTNPTTVSLVLSEPKILSLELNDYEIETADGGWWNKLTQEDQKTAVEDMIRTAKAEALDSSLRQEAKENIEKTVREIVGNAHATIDFQYGARSPSR
jgi:hypothetical protein